MAFNIMDMIMDQVTPDNLKAVAGMLGEDESKVSSAISGAAPAILGGLVSSLGKPEGKQAFEQQLEQADGEQSIDDAVPFLQRTVEQLPNPVL